jgi:hypothetical protein
MMLHKIAGVLVLNCYWRALLLVFELLLLLLLALLLEALLVLVLLGAGGTGATCSCSAVLHGVTTIHERAVYREPHFERRTKSIELCSS